MFFPRSVPRTSEVVRPWGTMKQFILNESGRTVNLLVVEPRRRLSLQSHSKRTEIWIVLEGTPLIRVDDDVQEYCLGETIRISAEAKHRLSNPGRQTVRVLEIAVGEYDPADIVRYEDDYGRAGTAPDRSGMRS